MAANGELSDSAVAVKTKTVVLNDITNSGVMAALVGGFALSNVHSGEFDHQESVMDNVTYLLLILAVHACTCSALTSALLYRSVNAMAEHAVPAWAGANAMMLLMPMAKFGMGCAAYIISVIVTSYRTLDEVPVSRAVALVIGVSSMSTVLMTVAMLSVPAKAAPEGKGA